MSTGDAITVAGVVYPLGGLVAAFLVGVFAKRPEATTAGTFALLWPLVVAVALFMIPWGMVLCCLKAGQMLRTKWETNK